MTNPRPSPETCAGYVETLLLDPCLEAVLLDVGQVCCGHGVTRRAYVCFGPGMRPGQSVSTCEHRTLRGQDALEWLRDVHGVGPRPLNL